MMINLSSSWTLTVVVRVVHNCKPCHYYISQSMIYKSIYMLKIPSMSWPWTSKCSGLKKKQRVGWQRKTSLLSRLIQSEREDRLQFAKPYALWRRSADRSDDKSTSVLNVFYKENLLKGFSLSIASQGTVCVVNAASERDVEVFAAGMMRVSYLPGNEELLTDKHFQNID